MPKQSLKRCTVQGSVRFKAVFFPGRGFDCFFMKGIKYKPFKGSSLFVQQKKNGEKQGCFCRLNSPWNL